MSYVACDTYPDLINNTVDPKDLADLKTQNELAEAWKLLVPLFPSDHVHVLPSVQDAVRVVHGLLENVRVDVLVAGSLHLVGGVIEAAGISNVALAT